MKTPIFITEKDTGDINTFQSIKDAESFMEPVDVKNGEYVVTDADGNFLSLEIVKEEVGGIMQWFFRDYIEKVRIIEP